MIHDIQGQGERAEERRILAVIAGEKSRAQEVAACFAEQGDRVKAVWYPDTRHLLDEGKAVEYEAVILFAPEDEAAGDAEEAEVRRAMRHTPLYRL